MAHKTRIDIYYEDTDCGGVVYYANYLRYFERARTRMLLDMGVDPAEWMKRGVVFAVARADIRYKGPAEYGDALTVETEITNVRAAGITFGYTIKKEGGDRTIVTGSTELACVNERMRPMRIPDEILDKIS